MSYRPGRGTAALLGTAFAVAVTTAVLASFFLFPGSGCNEDGCGDVSDPTVQAVGVAPTTPSPSASPPAESGPAATPPGGPAPSGNGEPAEGTSGDLGLAFNTQVTQPTALPPQNTASGEVSAMIHAGPLRVIPSTPGAAPGFSGYLKVNRAAGAAQGRLEPMIVQDFRGSSAGWTLTATMSDFTAAGGSSLNADHLTWVPTCSSHPGPSEPYPSTAVPGSPSSPGRTALLCSTPAARGVTGGQFDVGADLRLPVPAGTGGSGGYTATLMLTLA